MAEARQAGRTIAGSGAIWPNHPEKALACRREFAALYPNTARALICTVLEACQWLESPANRRSASAWLARPEYVNVPQEIIEPRLLGDYRGAALAGASLPVRFFDEAGMNFPLPPDGLWFLTQYYRWGMLKTTSNWENIAAAVSQTELYRQAAASLGYFSAPVLPSASTFMDGRVWDGNNALAYADSFSIRANTPG
jgi:nitrate/nitrite transport system substrate-binding protein